MKEEGNNVKLLFQLLDFTWELTSLQNTVKATYVSEAQVICKVPSDKHSFVVEITNNGTSFSEEVHILNYDKTCLNCNSERCTTLVSVIIKK